MKIARSGTRAREGPLVLSPELLEQYLEALAQQGRSPGTLESYRRAVESLYRSLPEDKTVGRDTLAQWRAELLDRGYAARTVNVRLTAANGLLDFLGHRELQLTGRIRTGAAETEGLTRTEYFRLLSAARMLEKHQTYLLVKVFGCTGIPLHELPKLTVEALNRDGVTLQNGQRLHIPEVLRRELLDFARGEGFRTGPLFRTRKGTPLARTAVTTSISHLAQPARLPEAKASPRSLRRMWQEGWDAIQRQTERMVLRTYDRLLETEHLPIAWDDGGEAKGA